MGFIGSNSENVCCVQSEGYPIYKIIKKRFPNLIMSWPILSHSITFPFFCYRKKPSRFLNSNLQIPNSATRCQQRSCFRFTCQRFSPCHGRWTIYRKVTVQTGYVGAENSSCCLYTEIGKQINTYYIMHVCAIVRSRLGCQNT